MSAERRAGLSALLKSRLLLIALWASTAGVVLAFREVLAPFAVALLLAYLLEPPVSALARIPFGRRSMPRWVAVIVCYVVFFGLLTLFGTLAVPQLYRESARLTAEVTGFVSSLTPEKVSAAAQRMEEWLLNHGVPVDLTGDEGRSGRFGLRLDLEQAMRETADHLALFLRTNLIGAFGFGQRIVTGVLAGVFRFFFVLMITAFVLIDWRRIGLYMRSLVPADRHSDFNLLMAEIDRRLGGVVRGQVIICLVNGSLTFIGLVILGVKFAFVLSVIAMVLSLIPIFGTIVSSVPIVLIALTQGFSTGFGALLWIVGIHALEAYFLNPKIMGSHAQIHPVLVAFALLAGEHALGFVGALFAVPLAAILVATFSFVHMKALAAQEVAATGPLPEAPRDEIAR